MSVVTDGIDVCVLQFREFSDTLGYSPSSVSCLKEATVTRESDIRTQVQAPEKL